MILHTHRLIKSLKLAKCFLLSVFIICMVFLDSKIPWVNLRGVRIYNERRPTMRASLRFVRVYDAHRPTMCTSLRCIRVYDVRPYDVCEPIIRASL